jgi:hypothetical protein
VIVTSPSIPIRRPTCFPDARPQQEKVVRQALAVALVVSLAVDEHRGHEQSEATTNPEFGYNIAT